MAWRNTIKGSLILLILSKALFVSGERAEGATYSAGVGLEFASGAYGTGVRTDSVYIPVTAGVNLGERLDFTLEVPLVYQSSSAIISGQYAGMPGMAKTLGATMGSMGGSNTGSTMMSSGSGMATSASAQNIMSDQYGLGDIKVKAGYVLYTEEEFVPAIRPNFYVKFPTADRSRFLGTGAFDEGIGVELTKWIGDWFTDGEVGYAIQGKSSVLAVKDYLYYYGGGGYQLTERLRPMLLLKGSTPTVEGASPLLEARLRVRYQMSKHTSLDGYLAKGIERDSPDYGIGAAFSYDF